MTVARSEGDENMEEQHAPTRYNKAYMLLLVPIIALNLWGGIYAVNAATSEQGALFELSNDVATVEKGVTSGGTALGTSVSSTVNNLVLSTSTTSFTYNGQSVKAVQPMVYKKGYHYVPLITMAKLFGLNLTYDSNTKETILSNKNVWVRFKAGSKIYTANGSSNIMESPAFTYQGNMMITIDSWARLTGSVINKEGKSLSLTWRGAAVEVEGLLSTKE